ncbi:MAG: hypothetical protein AAF899_07690, partial [Pseudomonadota bacterium]
MTEGRQRVDVRLGAFACSIEGFDAPEAVLRRLLATLADEAVRHPRLADAAATLDPAARARLVQEAARATGMAAERLDVMPGLIVAVRGAEGEDGHVSDSPTLEPATAEDIREALAEASEIVPTEPEHEAASGSRRGNGAGLGGGWGAAFQFPFAKDTRGASEDEDTAPPPPIDERVALDDAVEAADGGPVAEDVEAEAPAFVARPLLDDADERAAAFGALGDRIADAGDTMGPVRPPVPASLSDERSHEEQAEHAAHHDAWSDHAPHAPTEADDNAPEHVGDPGDVMDDDVGRPVFQMAGMGVEDVDQVDIAETPAPQETADEDLADAVEPPAEPAPWASADEPVMVMDHQSIADIDGGPIGDMGGEEQPAEAGDDAASESVAPFHADPFAATLNESGPENDRTETWASESAPFDDAATAWDEDVAAEADAATETPFDATMQMEPAMDVADETPEEPAFMLVASPPEDDGDEAEPDEQEIEPLQLGADREGATAHLFALDGGEREETALDDAGDVADPPMPEERWSADGNDGHDTAAIAVETESASGDREDSAAPERPTGPARLFPRGFPFGRAAPPSPPRDVAQEEALADNRAADESPADDRAAGVGIVGAGAAEDDAAEEAGAEDGADDVLVLTPVALDTAGEDPAMTIGPDGQPRRRRRRAGGSIFGAPARRRGEEDDPPLGLLRPFTDHRGDDPLDDSDAFVSTVKMTAQELSWKMEAYSPDDQMICAAAFITFVDGSPRFSRRAVLDVLDGIPGEVV